MTRVKYMQLAELMAWRKQLRRDLIQRRQAVSADRMQAWRAAIDLHLLYGFPGLAKGVLAFCWPIRKEYDARHLLRQLRAQGATTVLPAVVAPNAPLLFREWHPGVEMAVGKLDIPYPAAGAELLPDSVLLPVNGFDKQGYRLGYGGGFFDRTLQSLGARKPLVIGVGFELAALDTIRPQTWDIPMDYMVTERGVYRRDEAGLEFLGAPQAPRTELSSPVCYAADIAPGYFGEEPEPPGRR
jgi:5-formyltetrahydrofolate cyclo-ligase